MCEKNPNNMITFEKVQVGSKRFFLEDLLGVNQSVLHQTGFFDASYSVYVLVPCGYTFIAETILGCYTSWVLYCIVLYF